MPFPFSFYKYMVSNFSGVFPFSEIIVLLVGMHIRSRVTKKFLTHTVIVLFAHADMFELIGVRMFCKISVKVSIPPWERWNEKTRKDNVTFLI